MIAWLLNEKMPVWDEDPPAFLNPIEAAELAGMRFPKRRAEWLHGRWAAKSLLQKGHPACAQVSLAEIVIGHEPNRAPYAAWANGMRLPGCLSISHSGPLAASALALAPHLRVGIDLEKIEARPAGFFEAYFTPRENAYLRSRPPEAEAEMLTLLWSAKESVLKALRTGLAQDTLRVEIDLAGATRTLGQTTPKNQKRVGSKSNPPDESRVQKGEDEGAGSWQRFGIGGEAVAASATGSETWAWSGWWQVYQGYILTLAAAGPAGALSQGLNREIPFQLG